MTLMQHSRASLDCCTNAQIVSDVDFPIEGKGTARMFASEIAGYMLALV